MRKNTLRNLILLILLVFLISLSSCAAPETAEETTAEEAMPAEEGVVEEIDEAALPQLETLSKAQIAKSIDHSAVLAELRSGRPARLILHLDTPGYAMPSTLNREEELAVLNAIQDTQSGFQQSLYSPLQAEMTSFRLIPYVSVWVQDTGEYATVLSSDLVLSARQDVPVPVNIPAGDENPVTLTLADIDDSLGLSQAHALGYDGSGWNIAILDTGVDKDHAFLDDGKVIAEACFSTTDADTGSQSLCPEGASSSTSVNAAEPYVSGVCPDHACDHGTHVAAIAAGQDVDFTGAAPGAGVIAVQVFSAFHNSQYCEESESCALSWVSDQIRALEYIYEYSAETPVASINLSLGLGRNHNACEEDARSAIIETLTAAGIAVVISTGNNGFTDGIHAPACIPAAVAVSAVDPLENDVADFANAATGMVDIWAPGVSILSAVPTESFGAGAPVESWDGTSLAAPIVAGTWAIYRQVDPSAGVNEILEQINLHGIPLNDRRTENGTTAPLLSLKNAFLAPCTQIAPISGAILTDRKALHFNWTPVIDASGYEIEIRRSSQTPPEVLVVEAESCNLTQYRFVLLPGLRDSEILTWRVRALNASNHSIGIWSPFHVIFISPTNPANRAMQ